MKTDLFQFCGHCWVFQICWHTDCSTLTTSSFRTWNSSTGIPSPPVALSLWCFLSPTWFHIPGCLALDEGSHHRSYLGYEDLFLYSSSVYSCHLFLISSVSVRSIPFLSFIVPYFDCGTLLLLFSHPVKSDSSQPHGLQPCQTSLSLSISRTLSRFMSFALVIVREIDFK